MTQSTVLIFVIRWVVMMTTLSSLVAPDVIIMTAHFGIMRIPGIPAVIITMEFNPRCYPDNFDRPPPGAFSISHKTSYRKNSRSLRVLRFAFAVVWLLWTLTGGSSALLPRRLSNFKATQFLNHPISQPRNLARFYTSDGNSCHVQTGNIPLHQHPITLMGHWLHISKFLRFTLCIISAPNLSLNSLIANFRDRNSR